MAWLERVFESLENFSIYRGTIGIADIIEILLIAFLVYYILVWMKATRAWQLMKGLIVIGAFLALAYFLGMNTIIWIARNILSFAVIAIIIVMQPELRHALEDLGKKNFITLTLFSDYAKREKENIAKSTINAIVNACYEMGRAKTGALIVIEQTESLKEFVESGIAIDGIVSSQLLVNIFEHNTPLHDGAVIIRDNRIVAATCYLHLSQNLALSKELGTRHRAAVGVSEETDSFTIIVSEETGAVSYAYEGKLSRDISPAVLQKRLEKILNKQADEEETKKKPFWKLSGKGKNEENHIS